MARLATVREWLLRWAGVTEPDRRRREEREQYLAVIQVRTVDPKMASFYKSTKGGKSGSQDYGAAKRNVTNLGDVARKLARDKRLTVTLEIPDGLTMREQILRHHDVDLFIWGHGAGMVRMLWMRPGGLGIEISASHMSKANNHPMPPHHGGVLVAEGVGMERRDVWVESGHAATVNVRTVSKYVDQWLQRHPHRPEEKDGK